MRHVGALLVNFWYAQPVGHAIEALRYGLGYHRADPSLEISLLLNGANGVTQFLRYDNSSRLWQTEAKKGTLTLNKFTYSFQQGTTDRALRQSVTDLAGQATNYSYDALNRLEPATNVGGQTYAYSYDQNSNRLTQTIGGQQTSYGYNDADQLTSAGSTTFSYDLNGNELSNSLGRSFTYNPTDQVISHTPAGGSPIAMSYTGPGQFERVTRGGTSFTTGALGLGREQTGGATTDFTRDDEGLLLALRTGPAASDTYYPLFDGLGSVAGLTNSTGALVADYRYEPFGKRLSCTGSACSLANPYQWLGGLGVYLDEATGLYKMGTRYYDPPLGRFTQVDPVAGGSATAYDYVAQDPLNAHDPDGMAPGAPLFGDIGDCDKYTCHRWRQYMANRWKTAFRRNLSRELGRRWVKCALLVAGGGGIGTEAVISIRVARKAIREGKPVLPSIHRSGAGKAGTSGSVLVIASYLTGGCI